MAKRVSGTNSGNTGLLFLALGIGAAALFFNKTAAASVPGDTGNTSLADGLPLPGFAPDRQGHGDGQFFKYDKNSATANRDWLGYNSMISQDNYRKITEAEAKQVHDYIVAPPGTQLQQTRDAVMGLVNKWQIDTGWGTPWPLFNNKSWW